MFDDQVLLDTLQTVACYQSRVRSSNLVRYDENIPATSNSLKMRTNCRMVPLKAAGIPNVSLRGGGISSKRHTSHVERETGVGCAQVSNIGEVRGESRGIQGSDEVDANSHPTENVVRQLMPHILSAFPYRFRLNCVIAARLYRSIRRSDSCLKSSCLPYARMDAKSQT